MQIQDTSESAVVTPLVASESNQIEKSETLQPSTQKKPRLICLDVLRGITMVGMIMVDSMGNFNYVIWPLNESIWNGLSTADCVFPSFLFIMGLAVPLALKREDRHRRDTWYRILKRFALLFLIGNLLNFQWRIPRVFTESPFSGWRIMGVLQRISICYLTTSITFLMFPKLLYNAIFIALCIIIYLGFMHGYPVPDFNQGAVHCGRAVLSPQCNFGAFIDQHVFGNSPRFMIYPNDPEGLFSTLSALINPFAGLCYTMLMKYNSQVKGSNKQLLKWWGFLSLTLLTLGSLFYILEPVNKKRWSISFAFFTSFISGAALCLCFLLVDIVNKPFIKEKAVLPFLWLGMNPLFTFVAMICFDNLLMSNIKFDYEGKRWTVWDFITEKGLNSWINNEYVSSLIISILNLVLWTLIAWLLYRKKVFIKL